MRPGIQTTMILTVLFFILSTVNGEPPEVRDALVQFMSKLSPTGNVQGAVNWGWNSTSDPCNNTWTGVTCYTDGKTIRKIVLDGLNLTGQLDAASLCTTTALMVLSLNTNNVTGSLSEEISNCSSLTHIYLQGNRMTGSLPGSLSRLGNLKRIVVSDNGLSGNIPDLSRISGLLSFLAENNQLSGAIPRFAFSNLVEFNVSNNDLSGAIPDGGGGFNESSFLGNPGLCGTPLSNACPPSLPPPSPQPKNKGKRTSKKDYFIYSGYALIGLVVVSLIAFKLIKRRKTRKNEIAVKNVVRSDGSQDKLSTTSSGSKANRSEFSITSEADESGRGSSSLVVLSTQVVSGLKFEELLRSPAELLGRNRHATLYKVILNEQVSLVVKRTRDWDISMDDFKKRIQRIDQVKHPNVLSIVAFYCSRHEKLLVYEFQENGSLSKRLQGSQNGEPFFDWEARLNIAARVSTALAFMHDGLQADQIAHGNLKSSNILFADTMEPLISEYGLSEIGNQDESSLNASPQGNCALNDAFKTDIFNFGIVLLELLTGKVVESNRGELAKWVNSAIREEWTVEVFDKALVSGGANEELMVHLLQVALKCVDGSPPRMREVAAMIGSIKESEEQSVSISDP